MLRNFLEIHAAIDVQMRYKSLEIQQTRNAESSCSEPCECVGKTGSDDMQKRSITKIVANRSKIPQKNLQKHGMRKTKAIANCASGEPPAGAALRASVGPQMSKNSASDKASQRD
jgi:hypothetical protein